MPVRFDEPAPAKLGRTRPVGGRQAMVALRHHAFGQPHNARGPPAGLVHRDDHRRPMRGRLFEHACHHLRVVPVDRGERLVREQDSRPAHERSRHRHALTLPRGQLMRVSIPAVAHTQSVERCSRALLYLAIGRGGLVDNEPEHDVLHRGEAAEQALLLEQE